MFSSRQNQIISKICKFDEWFETLVKCKSYQVIEKMDHLWQNANLQLLNDKNFTVLLRQIEDFYEERLDPNSFWESMTDFNYQIRITWNDSFKEFGTNIVEKYPYDSDTDDESEDINEQKDIEDLICDTVNTEKGSAYETKNNSEHNF